LLLKTAVLDDHGGVIEQYAFTQLAIGGDIDRKWISLDTPTNDRNAQEPFHKKHPIHLKGFHHGEVSSVQPDNDGDVHQDGATHHEENSRIAHFMHGRGAQPVISGWKVDGLPDGFQKIAEVRRLLPGKDAPVIQMVFSDGLAGISVFIEKSDGDEDDVAGLSSKGLIQIYSKLVDGHLVTVVGEVPPRTVIQVADSVRYGGN
jgi:sigma-E factor negative regulatory protein RseB